MPRIGEFTETDFGLRGEIVTPDRTSTYEYERSARSGIDYIVKAPNGAEVGAAWDRESQRGDSTYIRSKIDDPDREQPLSFNLINEGNGIYGAMYSREAQKKSEQAREPRDMSEAMNTHQGPESGPSPEPDPSKAQSRSQ